MHVSAAIGLQAMFQIYAGQGMMVEGLDAVLEVEPASALIPRRTLLTSFSSIPSLCRQFISCIPFLPLSTIASLAHPISLPFLFSSAHSLTHAHTYSLIPSFIPVSLPASIHPRPPSTLPAKEL
jgi:hypothetical protein